MILKHLASGLALFSSLSSARSFLGVERAYPESCPPDPFIPDTTNADPSPNPFVLAASQLLAWQLTSLTGMGTPFAGRPCETGDAFDMTCIVPDFLSSDHGTEFRNKLVVYGLDPLVVDLVARQRVGCAANLDTSVVKQHIAQLFETYMSLTTTEGGGGGNGEDEERDELEIAKDMSEMFAWQLGGLVRDIKFAEHVCGLSLQALRSGLDLVGMDIVAFETLFCGFLKSGLPTAEIAAEKVRGLRALMAGLAFTDSEGKKLWMDPDNICMYGLTREETIEALRIR